MFTIDDSVQLCCDIGSDSDSHVEESDSEGEDTDEDLKEMSKQEEKDTKYLSIFENEYNDFDKKVMSLESFDELRKMEMAMTDRTDNMYYRCKIKYEQVYNEFIAAHRKNTTLDQLDMLHHDKSTQPNESMNNSVAAIAPKNNHFRSHLLY